MSVYGGDSWAREAQSRKRRIDVLMSEGINKADSHRLANGKYACLVCPNRPVLDTLPMLTTHNQGARHQAAASKLREKEISKQEEIQKRIALSEASSASNDDVKASLYCSAPLTSPLLQKTRKSTADALANRNCALGETTVLDAGNNHNFDPKSKYKPFFESLHAKNAKMAVEKIETTTQHLHTRPDRTANVSAFMQSNITASSCSISQHQLDLQKQREKELKLREAGWRRDGQGSWFREENVEFDSDEEDPNICLGISGS
eukprot:Gb_04653 [translate_table: standard]